MFLAKDALFKGPLGLLIRSLGAEPVKAGGNDIAAYRVAKAILDEGGVVAILPEGTRSFDGVLGTPKPGVSLLATRTGAPGAAGRHLRHRQAHRPRADVPRASAPASSCASGEPFRLSSRPVPIVARRWPRRTSS